MGGHSLGTTVLGTSEVQAVFEYAFSNLGRDCIVVVAIDQVQLSHDIVEPFDLCLNCSSVLAKGLAGPFCFLASLLYASHCPGYVANQQDLFTGCEVHVNHLRTRRVAWCLD